VHPPSEEATKHANCCNLNVQHVHALPSAVLKRFDCTKAWSHEIIFLDFQRLKTDCYLQTSGCVRTHSATHHPHTCRSMNRLCRLRACKQPCRCASQVLHVHRQRAPGIWGCCCCIPFQASCRKKHRRFSRPFGKRAAASALWRSGWCCSHRHSSAGEGRGLSFITLLHVALLA